MEEPNQTVSNKNFNKLKKELDEKIETINSLSKKIQHLENMITFKDERICNLTALIEQNHLSL